MRTIDPRIAERRRRVQEEQARGSTRRVLILMAVVVTVGALVWVGRSPWLRLRTVEVTGATQAPVEAILAEVGIAVGRPLIMVSGRDGEAALRADPWVEDAAITKFYPDRVEVAIRERTGVAVVSGGGAERLLAGDGTVLAARSEDALPLIQVPGPVDDVGERVEDPLLRGALSFAEALPSRYARIAVVSFREGEVWATFDTVEARLGRPVDMAQKSLALAAVLDDGQPPGSVVNVIAPTRPTVRPGPGPADADPDQAKPDPQPEVEG